MRDPRWPNLLIGGLVLLLVLGFVGDEVSDRRAVNRERSEAQAERRRIAGQVEVMRDSLDAMEERMAERDVRHAANVDSLNEAAERWRSLVARYRAPRTHEVTADTIYTDSIVQAGEDAVQACFAALLSCDARVAARDTTIDLLLDAQDLRDAQIAAQQDEIEALEESVPSFLDKLASHGLVAAVGLIVGALVGLLAGS